MKFEVKIFQETRRTTREYSQQTSGGRKVHCFTLSTSPGVGGATHLCNLCYDVVFHIFGFSYFASPFASCVLSEAETGGQRLVWRVERVREEGEKEEEWVEMCTVIAATVRWLIHPSHLDTRY